MGPLAHSLAALGALAAAPPALAALALRPAWRVGLGERLGGAPRLAPGAVWVHGASVGEIRAALGLLDRLRQDGHAVCASTTTVTGRAVLRSARPEVPNTLAPLEHPWCVHRALGRAAPAVLVLVETELWPVWIKAATRRKIPVVVVSGRISDRSLPRYERLAPLLRPTLKRIAAVGARTASDAGRFVSLGVPAERVRVTGDLKLEPDARPSLLADDLAAVLGELPLFVAGSTHAGEEDAALAALAEAEQRGLGAGLVLAPRRPERSPEVEANVRRAGRSVRRRSALDGRPLMAGEVLVLDGIGDLAAVYGRARVAFVGGSLAPRGGHNVLEPARAGVPVLFGPHTETAREGVALLLGCGAGRRVADAAALAREVAALLADPAAAAAQGAAGARMLAEHRGSAERSARLVEAVLAREAIPT